jgi:hypothetical protein
MDRTIVVVMSAALALILVVLELVRRRQLGEEYSLLWLVTSVVLLVLAGSRSLLELLAQLMGIAYPPSALFVVAFGGLLLAALHFSSAVTRLSAENRVLAQDLAILRWQVRRLEAQAAAASVVAPDAVADHGAAE